MKTQLLLLLAATAQAYDTMGEWCNECTTLVNSFDTMDAHSIADQLCPLIGEVSLCEDFAPYVIDWVQEHCTADLICSSFCDEDSGYSVMYDEYDVPFLFDTRVNDPEPTEDPPTDLHVTRDLGHHPFDIPHSEDPPTDLHEARDLGHHPFDIPHTEDPQPEDPIGLNLNTTTSVLL